WAERNFRHPIMVGLPTVGHSRNSAKRAGHKRIAVSRGARAGLLPAPKNDEAPGFFAQGFVSSIYYLVVGGAGVGAGGGGVTIGAVGIGIGLTTAGCVCCLLCRRRCLAASAVSGVRATPARATTTTIQVFLNMVRPPGRSVLPTNQEMMVRVRGMLTTRRRQKGGGKTASAQLFLWPRSGGRSETLDLPASGSKARRSRSKWCKNHR